jgi:hypothetical protein
MSTATCCLAVAKRFASMDAYLQRNDEPPLAA